MSLKQFEMSVWIRMTCCIYYTQVGFAPRQFEVSQLITLHSRRGENNPIYIWHVTESFYWHIVAQTHCPRSSSNVCTLNRNHVHENNGIKDTYIKSYKVYCTKLLKRVCLSLRHTSLSWLDRFVRTQWYFNIPRAHQSATRSAYSRSLLYNIHISSQIKKASMCLLSTVLFNYWRARSCSQQVTEFL